MRTRFLISLLSTISFGITAYGTLEGTNRLVLDFRDVPLRAVVDYFSEKAGLIVVMQTGVQGTVTVTARQPVSIAEAVTVLNEELARNNYAAILNGKVLTIMPASAARIDALTPIISGSDPATIPFSDRIITEIMPVHILNPSQAVKDLEPLIPASDLVLGNESGNAVIMTGPEKDIHRVAAILTALDGTATSEINVFALKYADAKSVADELKQLFQGADSEANRPGLRMSFNPRFQPRSADGGGDQTSKTAQIRAVFVADEQMNAVVASVAHDYMPTVNHVIDFLDRPTEDVTQMEVFALLHADAVEIADEITSAFTAAPANGKTGQSQSPMQIQFGAREMPESRSDTESDRLKRQSAVTAVADRRTHSVIVTASAETMAQIRKMVARLDEGEAGVVKLSVFRLETDAEAVQETLTALFSENGSGTVASVTTPLGMREKAQAASQSTPTTTSGSSSGISPFGAR
jgi:type II secretory pathway component GspD/PulD (secretin)